MLELRALALRHATPSCRELLPRLTLWTSYGPTAATPVIYEPMLYFTLQGTKRMTVGDRQLVHRSGTFLLASIDVPVVCEVIDCSPAQPYLGLAVTLDPAAITALLLDLPPDQGHVIDAAHDELEPMTLSPSTSALHDALLRFVRLIEAPGDIPLLAPMIERELLYRALQSEHGRVLRQFARADSRLSQIHRAVKWIRAHPDGSASSRDTGRSRVDERLVVPPPFQGGDRSSTRSPITSRCACEKRVFV